jgi:hypothetical protein
MPRRSGGKKSLVAIRIPRDILDNCAMDNNTTYNATLGTSKHVGTSWTNAQHLQETHEFSNPLNPGDWQDAKIRAQFPIFLSREAMGRG